MSIEVGDVVEGTVTGITKFGAFVELDDNKVGLIHISEVADVYVNDVKDFLKEGQKVKVKVLNVDDRGKIGLSIKRLTPKRPEVQKAGVPAHFSHVPKRSGRFSPGSASFEDKLSKFMKESDERLTDFRRRTDSKRGGRGARHSG